MVIGHGVGRIACARLAAFTVTFARKLALHWQNIR